MAFNESSFVQRRHFHREALLFERLAECSRELQHWLRLADRGLERRLNTTLRRASTYVPVPQWYNQDELVRPGNGRVRPSGGTYPQGSGSNRSSGHLLPVPLILRTLPERIA